MRGLATLWGLGRIGPAPGTLGALAALPLGWLLHWLGGFPGLAAGTVAVTLAGHAAIRSYLPKGGAADPQEVIVDETAGQLLALWPLSAGLWLAGAAPHLFPWPGWVGAFVLFRLFDIWKPGPIRRLEALPGATGVMADDLGAGAAAALCVALLAALAHGVAM
jgi:phosphatidylglycerophosphatase A